MFIIPYLVLAGVVLLFFAVTCLMIFGLPGKKKNGILICGRPTVCSCSVTV